MAARAGGRFPPAADPKPRWSPQGAVPNRGTREGGECGRADARERIGDPRGARAQPRVLARRAPRGDREDALRRPCGAAANVAADGCTRRARAAGHTAQRRVSESRRRGAAAAERDARSCCGTTVPAQRMQMRRRSRGVESRATAAADAATDGQAQGARADARREREPSPQKRQPSATPQRVRRHDGAGARSAANSCCYRLRHRDTSAEAARYRDRKPRGSDRASDHTQRARADERYVRRHSEPPPRKGSGQAPRRRGCGGTTMPAPGASTQRRRQRRRGRRATATAPRVEATAPTTTRRGVSCRALRAPTERATAGGNGGRAPRRRERDGTTMLAPGAPVRRRRQRRRGRRATATTPRKEATAPTTTRREHEPPSATRTERASRRNGSAAVERQADASAAARPSRRRERQRIAAGSGAVGAARQLPPPERKRPRQRPHTDSASRRAPAR